MVFRHWRRRARPIAVPLASPRAAQLLRMTPMLTAFDSLSRVVHLLQHEQLSALPVMDGALLIGWVTESRVTDVLAMGEESAAPLVVADIASAPPLALAPAADLTVMLEAFQACRQTLLPVVNEGGVYLGCVARADLLAALLGKYPIPKIGGMATPLGVYLTTGRVSGGAGLAGLLLAGAMMAAMLWLIETALILAALWLYQHTHLAFFLQMTYPLGVNGPAFLGVSAPPMSPLLEAISYLATSGLLVGIFLLGLRVLPLMAGYHAAEHQTVNALERGEPLHPDQVARMPRVHPRCGTNLWALLSLSYLASGLACMLMTTEVARANLPAVMVGLVWAMIAIVLSWRRIGGWLQEHITTRRASAREIASGIRAGHEVLARHLTAGSLLPPTGWQRLWQMGLAQVLFGALLMGYLLQLLDKPLDVFAHYLLK